MKVTADQTRCMGYGNCVAAAPDFFELGDEGIVRVLRHEVPDDSRAHVQAAVQSCPVSALQIDDE